MTSPRRSHWDDVYTTKPADTVSWFQDDPTPSLDMIALTGLSKDAPLVDIGGGASVLIDRLLDRGHSDLTVLDIAQAGLAVARTRLGERAELVTWIAQDVTAWQPPKDAFSIWHDRAVFHFLVDEADRLSYRRALDRGVRAGGFVILAPFALSGPERCSGLPVRRYSADMLQAELGPAYDLIDQQVQTHVTPTGNHQYFIWCLLSASSALPTSPTRWARKAISRRERQTAPWMRWPSFSRPRVAWNDASLNQRPPHREAHFGAFLLSHSRRSAPGQLR